MRNIKKTLIAIATVLPFFAFNAAAEDSAVTQQEAQQIRVAAISVEQSLEQMRSDIKAEEEAVEVTAMTQLNVEYMDMEVEEDLENNEEYQELVAD
ncbi:hypothetical protein [Thalassotalea sp. Y01]|uniref:hypothetical protein n=1 Tax=Thalassotalea sp. Y01 TaxID=2729613 RepID=UPI00145CB850|nr:hypothetical protein [Thalassotalea sp. Y01]NMP16420.1 hypothetical protein [Thalassotalea sp. Y01]